VIAVLQFGGFVLLALVGMGIFVAALIDAEYVLAVIGSGAFLTGAYRGWLVRPDRHQ
jgi:hypothetical protein